MEKIKYEWLYIIFVHEDDIIFKGTHLRSHLKNQIDSLSECTFNDKIKVIIIQNTRKIYRALSSTENKLLGIKGGRAFLYETRTYDSFNLNEKVELKEIHKTNYWQNAFDFTFKEFEAKNYVLHTVSHCTGHQINCTNDGFAQNIFGNHLKKYENKFSNNNIGFFKKTFRKIVSKRENKFFLISGQPKFNSKKIKLFALQKKHIKQWPKYNFTNGLLFFDFIRYLKSTNIKFEYVFLNNCHAMLYENVFLLNGLANFVFGTTGLIKDTFVNAGIVYNNLLTKNRKAEDIVMTIFNEFRKKLPEMNEIRHYTIIRAKDNVILHNTFAKIIGEIVKKFQQSNEYKIALINFIDSRRENGLNIISDEPERLFYDVLTLVKYFEEHDPSTFKLLVNDFEQELFNILVQNHSDDSKKNYLSISLPTNEQMFGRLTHVRNFYKPPYNSFSQKMGLDIFIYNLNPI